MEQKKREIIRKREPIRQSIRFNVFRRDNFSCVYCGRSSPEVVLHCDHAKSFKDGGECTEKNLVTACEDCNSGKSSKSIAPRIASKPVNSDAGLVGMWGHTYHPEGHPYAGEINWQFKILRLASEAAYVCQLFSWMDGAPTDCKIISTGMLANDCKLYVSHQAMDEAYCKYCERESRKRDRECGLAVANYKWPDFG